MSHEPTHPRGSPSRPLRCLNCSLCKQQREAFWVRRVTAQREASPLPFSLYTSQALLSSPLAYSCPNKWGIFGKKVSIYSQRKYHQNLQKYGPGSPSPLNQQIILLVPNNISHRIQFTIFGRDWHSQKVSRASSSLHVQYCPQLRSDPFSSMSSNVKMILVQKTSPNNISTFFIFPEL